MSRHTLRENAMTCLYQYFLLHSDIKAIVYDVCGNEVDPFLYTVTIDAVAHLDHYVNKINEVLTDEWKFDRLGCVEKAILLIAAAELDFETAAKSIVIDEAVMLSKKYCDEETYKLVNGVLDQL